MPPVGEGGTRQAYPSGHPMLASDGPCQPVLPALALRVALGRFRVRQSSEPADVANEFPELENSCCDNPLRWNSHQFRVVSSPKFSALGLAFVANLSE